MSIYHLSHLSDPALLRDLSAHVARGRANTAIVLAHVAEVDARRLYLPAGHPSMFSYVVHELRFEEDAAFKRIHAARTARRFPAIFDAVSKGELHLGAVILLAPHLTLELADDLLTAASGKTKKEIEVLIARRFPRPDVPTRIEPIAAPGPELPLPQHAPGRVGDPAGEMAPAQTEAPAARAQLTPLSAEAVLVKVTIDSETRVLLHEAQELLGHQIAPGDVAAVIKRALQALVPALRKRRFAATDKPQPTRRSSKAPRHIPAHVKRAVWERDGGQCTFVSDTGKRCPARSRLEFDHVLEVARGGRATLAGIRLRCRAHNQYTAECAFGAAFMQHKREQAQALNAHATQRTPARIPTAEDRGAVEAARACPDNDVAPWLGRLGFRSADVRQAITFCEGMPDATLEDRVGAALGFLRPRTSVRREPPRARA